MATAAAPNSKSWKVSVRTILPVTTVGMSMSVAWFFTIFQGTGILVGASSGLSTHALVLLRACMLLSAAVTFIILSIIVRRSSYLATYSSQATLILSFALTLPCPLLCIAGFFLPLPFWLLYIGGVCAGVAFAFFLGQWGELLVISWKHDVGGYLSIAVILGIVISFFIVNLTGILPVVALLLLPICSYATMLYVRKNILVKVFDNPLVPVWKIVLLPKTSCIVALYGILYGVLLYFIYTSSIFNDVMRENLIGILFVFGAVAHIICLYILKRYIPFGSVQRLVLPVMAVIFLAMCAVPENAVFVFSCIACAIMFFLSVTNYASIIALSSEYQASVCSMMAGGRIFLPLGTGIGILLGVCASDTLGFGRDSIAYIGLVVIILLAIVAALASFTVNPIDDKESDVDLFGQGLYYRKCEVASTRYGLSKRESEVLPLLGRGRNAKFIGDSLYVSAHTAKTHIYHIYRKMDISSQQELMDIIENIEV